MYHVVRERRLQMFLRMSFNKKNDDNPAKEVYK